MIPPSSILEQHNIFYSNTCSSNHTHYLAYYTETYITTYIIQEKIQLNYKHIKLTRQTSNKEISLYF